MSKRSVAAIEREAAILSAQIAVLQRREIDFERVLTDMHSLHDSVQTERLALEVKRRNLDAERLPINWLPVELLVHVFIAYVDDDDFDIEQDQPFHRPPVILSHVCQKWRHVALSTSRLWSRIRCRRTSPNPASLAPFLERSGNCPLDIVYTSPPRSPHEVNERMSHLLFNISVSSTRWQSIVFGCWDTEIMQRLFQILQRSSDDFPSLQCLDLALISPNPSFKHAQLLLMNHDPVATPSPSTSTSSNIALKRLRLEKVPFLALPKIFFSDLRYLELVGFQRHSSTYSLRMSSLCRLFSHVSRLEELVLLDTTLSFDVFPALDDGSSDSPAESADDNGQDSQTSGIFVRPVELLSLNRLEWSYPPAADIYRFLSFLIVPSLEKTELYLGDSPGKRTQPGWNGETGTTINLHFGCLKELSIQCEDLDSIGYLLRKMACPLLEKLEIAGAGMSHRQGVVSPVLPRLESIFRDPRLPHLTHLTLSHLDICTEHGRAMLGYMPALVSLSLDVCKGVGKLIESLSDELPCAVVIAVPNESHHHRVPGINSSASLASIPGRRRRGVRFCPQLESLSLWGCSDVEFAGLRTFLTVRNCGVSGHGLPQSSNTDAARAAFAADGGRMIKPLRRRLRRQVDDKGAADGTPFFSQEDTGRSVFGVTDVSHVSRISYLRIKGCSSITEEDVFWLKELKVEHLVWSA